MTVFRVEKSKNYTVMSNEHLRNKEMSLKAKGLLSQMLSLPDSWDYSLEGLSRINREGIDAIRTAIQELERFGYLERKRVRDSLGRLAGTEYVVHERSIKTGRRRRLQPDPEPADEPMSEIPMLDIPTQDIPAQDGPAQGHPRQSSTERRNKEKSTSRPPARRTPSVVDRYACLAEEAL